MAGQALEQAQRRGTDVKGKLLRTAGLAVFTVKAIAGVVESAPSPTQAANRGSDRPGIFVPIPNHVINTLGNQDNSDKNSNIGKGKTGVSTVANPIPDKAIEGKYTSNRYQPDNNQPNVVFKNTQGGKNVGPDSAKIAKYNATTGPDWSASSSKKLDKRKVTTFAQPQSSDIISPNLSTDLGGAAMQTLETFLAGGPILAACAPIPNITPTKEAVKSPAKLPTLTPDPTLSDQVLGSKLAAYTKDTTIDISDIPPADLKFITYYMGVTAELLLKRFPQTDISEFSVKMPLNRKLLDSWEKDGSAPSLIIQHGQDQYTLFVIKRGATFDNLLVKLGSDPSHTGFTIDGSTLVEKGTGTNPVTGTPQKDKIWSKPMGIWYDSSSLPADTYGIDVNSALVSFAPQIATAARRIYGDFPDAELSVMPDLSNGTSVNFVITDAQGNRRIPNNKGEVSPPIPRTPKDMHGRFDGNNNWIWERQGTTSDSDWQTIAMFNPVTGVMENVAASATTTPSPSSTATKEATRAPTATATPEINKPDFNPTQNHIIVNTDFENGLLASEFSNNSINPNREKGPTSKIEVIPDDTGSNRGKVLAVTLSGEGYGNNGVHRAYVGFEQRNLGNVDFVSGVVNFSVDFHIKSPHTPFLSRVGSQGAFGYLSFVDIFDYGTDNPPNYHVALQLHLVTRNGKEFINVYTSDYQNGNPKLLYESKMPINDDEWHNLAFKLTEDKKLYLRLDEKIDPDLNGVEIPIKRVGVAPGSHIGAYAGKNINLLNLRLDNLKVAVGSSK